MNVHSVLIVSAIALLTCACGNDVRNTRISDIDLTDAVAVQKVANKLEPNERASFGTYVLNRTIGAMIMPGGEIVRSDGKAPETVAEAIMLTDVRKAKNDRRDKVMKERDAIVERHNQLMPDDGTGLALKDKAEWDRLETKIADYDKRIEIMR